MADNITRSKGEHNSIQDLLLLTSSGELRIPEFQRSFRWANQDVLALFDSLLRGYPVGSVLLWRKSAPSKRVTLGALVIDAPEQSNALWVVDGQQRITSLVNAVSPEAYDKDDRFRLVYALEGRRVMRPNEARGHLAIPLPDLFDIARLLDWLQNNPEAQEYAGELQNVTARLRDFKLPASVVEQADESVLRDIFDRINSTGKRLRSAEIFDAIHRAGGATSDGDFSIGAVADRLDAATGFGRLDDAAIYQAILVRRHPDITRDPHAEFDASRRSATDFPGESRDEGYRGAEDALENAVSFLIDRAGVPHVTFLPYRFLLLVLVRFFALFPDPHPRNLELLSRWFWLAATRATELSLSGSTGTVRSLAGNIEAGDESGSVQRLHRAVHSEKPINLPDVRYFRTNQAASKVTLCSLWALRPRDLKTGLEVDRARLAEILDGKDTPSDVAVEIAPRTKLSRDQRLSAGNRMLAPLSDESRLLEWSEVADYGGSTERIATLATHLLDPQMLVLVGDGMLEQFVSIREEALLRHLASFVKLKTGAGLEPTAPLDEFDLDDDTGPDGETELEIAISEL